MLIKLTTLAVIGFVALTAQAQDSIFSLAKKKQPTVTVKPVQPAKPVKPVTPFKKPYKKPIKIKYDNDYDEDDKWTNYTQEVFYQCDYNESGFINQDEYVACQGFNDPEWSELIRRFDLNMDQILSWEEAYNAAKYFDKHLLTLTSQDLDEDKNTQISFPADLDDKMARIQFSFDNTKDSKKLMGLWWAGNRKPIDLFFASGDKDLNGSLSKDEFLEANKKYNLFDSPSINLWWPKIDTNYDGLVTKGEFISFTRYSTKGWQDQSSSQAAWKLDAIAKAENFIRQYDTDRNNQLSRTEITSISDRQYPYQKDFDEGLFDELDTNKDGELSLNEFQDGMEDGGSYNIKTKAMKARGWMNRYDNNNDRELDFTEVKALLIGIGQTNPSNNDVKWFISLMDTNLDSKISKSELLNGLQ